MSDRESLWQATRHLHEDPPADQAAGNLFAPIEPVPLTSVTAAPATGGSLGLAPVLDQLDAGLRGLPGPATQDAMDRFLSEVEELLDAGRRAEALDRIVAKRRELPTEPRLLRAWIRVLVADGHGDEALPTLLAMRDRLGEELFNDLLSDLIIAWALDALEKARQSLRRGEYGPAMERLDWCRIALAADRRYQALCAFTYELHAKTARGRKARRARALRVKLGPVDAAVQQSLLHWLLAEELAEGQAAFNDHRFRAAAVAFEAAGRIDERCAAAAFGRALALYYAVTEQPIPEKAAAAEQAYQDLLIAAKLVNRVAAEPAFDGPVAELAAAIERRQQETKAAYDHASAIENLAGCESRYQELITLFDHPLVNVYQLNGAKVSFRQLRMDAATLADRFPPDTAERANLDRLIGAIMSIENQLYQR